MTTPDIRQIGGSDLGSITPPQFAAMIKQASKKDLEAVMTDPQVRPKMLDAVFARMSDLYKGGRSTKVVHWKIQGRPDGGEDLYETVLDTDTCTVSETADRSPDVVLMMSGPEFLKLASGNAAPPMLFLTGKLKVTGDVGLAAALGNLFDIPKA